jgi:hypothetical protein
MTGISDLQLDPNMYGGGNLAPITFLAFIVMWNLPLRLIPAHSLTS